VTETTLDTAEHQITVELPRFGTCTYAEAEVITFPWGLPGFSSLRRFLALTLKGQERFVWLQSLDDVSVALPMADPWQIFPDYAPRLPGYATSSLEITAPDDFATLCVIVVTSQAAEMTMNLLAPVIINLKTNVGRQITLETGGYSVRTPVPKASPAPAGP
jgi:flagellar assembly factor FliW